jgi:hypothetical protein
MAMDAELTWEITNNWRALGAQLAPAIENVTWLFKQFVRVIYSIILALTGIDLIARANAKVILLTYLLINVLYIIIDCAYVFWFEQLKYVFPKEYLKPVENILMGIVDNALIKFKLKKEKTNIISEANAQKSGQPYVKSSNEMKNGGVNVLESILKDSFGANVEGIDNYNNNENNKDGSREIYPNNKPPQSEDIKINEIKLDD